MNLELYHFVWGIAAGLDRAGIRMKGSKVALLLNANGFHTSYGKPYRGRRGIFKLFASVWRWLKYDMDLPKEAQKVAYAFTDRNGRIPHE